MRRAPLIAAAVLALIGIGWVLTVGRAWEVRESYEFTEEPWMVPVPATKSTPLTVVFLEELEAHPGLRGMRGGGREFQILGSPATLGPADIEVVVVLRGGCVEHCEGVPTRMFVYQLEERSARRIERELSMSSLLRFGEERVFYYTVGRTIEGEDDERVTSFASMIDGGVLLLGSGEPVSVMMLIKEVTGVIEGSELGLFDDDLLRRAYSRAVEGLKPVALRVSRGEIGARYSVMVVSPAGERWVLRLVLSYGSRDEASAAASSLDPEELIGMRPSSLKPEGQLVVVDVELPEEKLKDALNLIYAQELGG